MLGQPHGNKYVDVYLIWPWKITTGTNQVYEFLALTCIDRVTGIVELIRIDNKELATVRDKFAECCRDLRYLRYLGNYRELELSKIMLGEFENTTTHKRWIRTLRTLYYDR